MTLMVTVSGIRGIVGDSMTPDVVAEFAAAYGTWLGPTRVVVARDSRQSGQELCSAAIAGLTECGCQVVDLGIVTTPGAALMVHQLRAGGGFVVTASHNPAEWNGIKFLNAEGLAPPYHQAREIWSIRESGSFAVVPPGQTGSVMEDRTTHQKHTDAVLRTVETDRIAGRKYRVVLDSVNGAGCHAGRLLLERLGCELIHLNGEPNGDFAHPPEPIKENLSGLGEAVREHGADIGFAQDPDADRLAIVDDRGRYIGEEYTLALAAKELFKTRPGPAATNLSTSRMIDDIAEAAGQGCIVHRTAVGEANVVEGITKHGCVFGGEGNGGVIDPSVVAVRDSLVAMALTLQLLTAENRPLSAIVPDLPPYHMIKRKMKCDLTKVPAVLDSVRAAFAEHAVDETDGIRVDLEAGWIHVRGSNTEPIIRIIAEGQDQHTAQSLVDRVMKLVQPDDE